MKTFKNNFKEIFAILAVMALFLAACEFVAPEKDGAADESVGQEDAMNEDLPEIGVTRIDADFFPPSDEWLIVPLDELPFQVQIPSWWAFREDPPQYSLVFDDGLSGSIVFLKRFKTEGWKDFSEAADVLMDGEGFDVLCYELNCAVKIDDADGFYEVLISDKTLTDEQLEEAYEILRTISLD